MTLDQLPKVRLVIGEPFALNGITGLTDNWKDFHTYREVAKRVAHKYRAAFIPYQSVFEKAMRNAPAGYFSTDGVHPRSEEHTSELQSLMRISYAVFCWNKKKT